MTLAYEGPITAATIGGDLHARGGHGAPRRPWPTRTPSTGPVPDPNGRDANDAATDWAFHDHADAGRRERRDRLAVLPTDVVNAADRGRPPSELCGLRSL